MAIDFWDYQEISFVNYLKNGGTIASAGIVNESLENRNAR